MKWLPPKKVFGRLPDSPTVLEGKGFSIQAADSSNVQTSTQGYKDQEGSGRHEATERTIRIPSN